MGMSAGWKYLTDSFLIYRRQSGAEEAKGLLSVTLEEGNVMDTTTFYMATIIGSLVAGIVFGVIPLVLGLAKGKGGLGAIGFVCCIVGSFIFGIFLSLPCCIGFTAAILVTANRR